MLITEVGAVGALFALALVPLAFQRAGHITVVPELQYDVQ